MKTMKPIYALAAAVALTLTGTGCKHSPGKITDLPNGPNGMIGDQQLAGPVIPPGPPIDTTPIPAVTPGNLATANLSGFDNYAPDPSAPLAAYTIHFSYDSAAIRSSEQANLQSVASALSSDPSTKLEIQGNCDERGTEEYNRALGERRALAAREALAKLGIDPLRIRTISYGKDKPVDPGHDAAAWAKNRRDDFVLLRPKTGA